jgi:hypothetical protein
MSFASFPQMLGGGCREELVFCAAGSAGTQLTEPKNALQIGKDHLDILSLPAQNDIGLGLVDYARPVSSDFTAALWLKRAETAGVSAATA